MNILITFAVADYTGASQMGLHYIKALKSAQHNVVAVTQEPPPGAESIVAYLHEERIPVYHFGDFAALLNPALIWRLRQCLLDHNIDVAISMNQMDVKTTSWASRLAGVRYVAFVQNQRNFYGSSLLKLLKEKVYGLSLRRCATKVIGVSDFVTKEAIDRFHFPAKETVTIPNGIDLNRFPTPPTRDTHFRTQWGISKDDIVLVNVARIHPQKGQDLLLLALASLPAELSSFTLLLVGPYDTNRETTNFHTQIEQLCKTRNLSNKVRFCGLQSSVYPFLANADIYVHPSRWEGLPLALLEAMASGLPVIASDCSGILDQFTNGEQGYYVSAGNTPDLTAALTTLMEKSREERERMGQKGRELVNRHYELNQGKTRFLRTIESAVGP